MCVVTAKALKEYMIKRVEMANELDALKASAPKCAKTEVIEPSKHKDAPITPPPKPAVPFKPERNL